MAFFVQDKQGAHAADVNQQLDQLEGTGIVAGGEASDGATLFSINFSAVTALINGDVVNAQATSVDLEQYVDQNDPRKVIVHIDANGQFGVTPGTPEDPEPNDALRFDTYRPAPPDLSDRNVAPLAEVWLDQRAGQVTDTDVRDRRVYVALNAYSLGSHKVDTEEIVDGSGTSHTGELADVSDIRTDAEIRTTIDNDTNHGQDAYHEYFSGDHKDLVDVQPDQHHTRFTEGEARNAVRGGVDAADLAGSGTSGDILETNGTEANWATYPRAEAPTIKEGTFTHTGGSATTVVISGISTIETQRFGVYFAVDTDPGFSGDYAFNTEVSKSWNDSAGEWDIDVTLSWDTDPGSGNDLEIRYTAYDVTPAVVQEKYSDLKAVNAMTGATIYPDRLRTSTELKGPVYDNLSDHPNPTLGDIAIASGNGGDAPGQYLYDGSQFTGPFSSGVTALSQLNIDTQKSWGGYAITNLGKPPGDQGAARFGDIGDAVEAHNEQTSDRRYSFDVSTDSSGGYFKLATISDSTAASSGSIQASVYASRNKEGFENYVAETKTLIASCEDGNLNASHMAKGDYGAPNAIHLLVTKDPSTEDFYLYAHSETSSAAKVTLEASYDFGGIDYQAGLSASQVIGTVQHTTDDSPDLDVYTGDLYADDLNADRVYDDGNRVVTDRYSDDEAKNAVVGDIHTVNIPGTQLEPGETVETWVDYQDSIDTNKGNFKVLRSEWQTPSGDHPNGGYFDILVNGNQVASSNLNQRSTRSNPFYETSTSGIVTFRIRNNTGSTQKVSGLMQYSFG